MTSYLTIEGQTETVEVISRSKFICCLMHVESEEQAREFIELKRKEHSLANHNCYAYLSDEDGLTQKFSDDGEPQGTAGMPMLNILRNSGLRKVVAVVTRYFGGVKLGTGGLVRAYGGAVSKCIKSSVVVNMHKVAFMDIVTDYDGFSKLSSLLKKLEIPQISVEYGNVVQLKIALKIEDQSSEERFISKLYDLFNGKEIITKKEYGYHPFKV